MTNRIKAKEVAENEGFDSVMDLIGFLMEEDSGCVPACCSEGCQVEPDGRCPHGCPSVMLAVGII